MHNEAELRNVIGYSSVAPHATG